MEELDRGSGRIVYQLDEKFVLKVPYGDSGVEQNKTELFVYNNANDFFKKYLSPVFEYENNSIKMLKIETITEQEYNKNIKDSIFYNKIISELMNQFNLNDDIKHFSSWGKLEGKYMLLDYGYSEELFNKLMWEYTRDVKYLQV